MLIARAGAMQGFLLVIAQMERGAEALQGVSPGRWSPSLLDISYRPDADPREDSKLLLRQSRRPAMRAQQNASVWPEIWRHQVPRSLTIAVRRQPAI
jgi:hypothetical protein